MEPIQRLMRDLRGHSRVVVAYSGGVDSAVLADVASEVLGEAALIVTGVSPSLSPRERAAASALAEERGWRHREVTTAELDDPSYRANAGDRCYFCKSTLFEALAPIARAEGAIVAVGTNLDDLADHRPGLRAAAEAGVCTPLVEAGFDKTAVRAEARRRGLPVAEKPATPCLASRIAYGIEVTAARLARIAAAEEVVREEGFTDLRVRDHGDLARIEVPAAEIAKLLAEDTRTRVEEALRHLGYLFVTIDAAGLHSGGMNAMLTRIERVRP